jgi:hypothetical protein
MVCDRTTVDQATKRWSRRVERALLRALMTPAMTAAARKGDLHEIERQLKAASVKCRAAVLAGADAAIAEVVAASSPLQ